VSGVPADVPIQKFYVRDTLKERVCAAYVVIRKGE
jgi:hypothetical protein